MLALRIRCIDFFVENPIPLPMGKRRLNRLPNCVFLDSFLQPGFAGVRLPEAGPVPDGQSGNSSGWREQQLFLWGGAGC